MKTVQEITSNLEKKIAEHKNCVEEISEDLQKQKKDGKIESAYKHMILKDRIMFHKACIAALSDLLKDINT